MPLRRARRNVQGFLLIAAVQSWVLAALVALGATGGRAIAALAVTVTAEVALSVLFATAWQPLLSVHLDARTRQHLNAGWSALARGILAGALVVFAALGSEHRALFLAVVGALAVAAAAGLRTVEEHDADVALGPDPTSGRRLPAGVGWVFLAIGVLNLGALPLWLVHLREVLWPAANLGVVGAVQTAASVAALLLWRSTEGDPLRPAAGGLAAVVLGAVLLVALDAPVGGPAGQAGVLAVTVLMAGGGTTARLGLLERTHRLVDARTSVRAFTLLDVVASTSLQVGLLAGGLLTTLSADVRWPIADPYRLLVIASALAAVAALRRLRHAEPTTG
jgi:hypothetical protein